jgi:uncharacterized membrane protein
MTNNEQNQIGRYAIFLTFALLALIFANQMFDWLPALPDQVAIHFSSTGDANGWSSKSGFAITAGIELAVAIVLFIFASLLKHLPIWLINIPNKSYWLSPEHAEATRAYLVDWVRWLLLVTLAYLVVLNTDTISANFVRPRPTPYSIWPTVTFVVLLAAFVIDLLLHFRKRGPRSKNVG